MNAKVVGFLSRPITGRMKTSESIVRRLKRGKDLHVASKTSAFLKCREHSGLAGEDVSVYDAGGPRVIVG